MNNPKETRNLNLVLEEESRIIWQRRFNRFELYHPHSAILVQKPKKTEVKTVICSCMYRKFNSGSPFYSLDFNYDSSDSESDFEDDMATNTANKSTTSSKVHKELLAFFKTNPLPEAFFQNNLKIAKAMFEAPAAMWKAYEDARTAFPIAGSAEDKVAGAEAIAAAAVAIRMQNALSAGSVITEHTAVVNIVGLQPAEVACLTELHNLVIGKMTKGQTATTPGQADQMLNEFIADIDVMKATGVIPSKWIVKNRVWKCHEHAKRVGKTIPPLTADTEHKCSAAVWAEFLTSMNAAIADALPDDPTMMPAMSNKFSIDPLAVVINRFKTEMPEVKRTWAEFLRFIEVIAIWTLQSSVSKLNWTRFVTVNTEWTPVLKGLSEASTLYDNPAKMTKNRLFACAGVCHPSSDPTAIFGSRDRLGAVPKLIALIYDIEKKGKEISSEPGQTSDSEHLFHLMMTMGSNYSYAFNRSMIKGSIRETKFNVNSGAEAALN